MEVRRASKVQPPVIAPECGPFIDQNNLRDVTELEQLDSASHQV
jgi:hypothetical protein